METSNRIALIMPYFGKWPEWIDLFFYSCGKNTFIDFHVFTDCVKPHYLPHNVFYNIVSWDEYCAKVSRVLKLDFRSSHKSYKLCDLRPFYGLIHEDIIQYYDFWGYGDIDLCYGNLRRWINDCVLQKYDVISSHANRLSGHFCLVRNNDELRNAAFKFHNWSQRLQDEKVYGFDEYDFTEYFIPNIKWVHRLHRYVGKLLGIGHYKFFSLMIPLFTMNKRMHFKEMNTSPAPQAHEEWKYDIKKGEIYAPNGKSLPYLHFLFFKKTPFYDATIYWKDDYWRVSSEVLQSGVGFVRFTSKSAEYTYE